MARSALVGYLLYSVFLDTEKGCQTNCCTASCDDVHCRTASL